MPERTRKVKTTFKVSAWLGNAATSTFCRLGFSIAASSLAASWSLVFRRLEMVPRTDLTLISTAGQAGEGVNEARGRMLASMEAAKTNLLQLQEAAVAKAKAAGHAADEYVHDNPWKAIGAAAGIGLLAGLLISRR